MKKLVTAFLVAVMVVSTLVPAASAKENASLTEAMKLAKSLFPTEGYTQFWSSQESYNGQTTYYLYWSEEYTGDRSPARLTVRVDAQRQLVTGYNHEPAYKNQDFPALPTLSKEECQKIAESFALKLAPVQFGEMRLEKVEEPQIRLEKRSWPYSYTYRYVQYVNGIVFQPNNLYVNVNADTGAVQDYYLTWADYEFPAVEGALTLEEAQEVFKTKGLKLVYLRQYNWRENTNKPYLAYMLENGLSMQIDAFTGEITYGSYYPYPRAAMESVATKGMGVAYDSFTPWELEEIETVAGLLTIDKIEAIAREIIDLPEQAQLRSSRLMEDKSQNVRFWNLDWEYMVDDYYVGASARLNAADGEIQNFYFYEKVAIERIEPKLEYEEALKIAQEFLQKWVPAKYADVELTSEYEHVDGQPLPYSYGFNFERRINGVPVVGDYLSINVQHDKRVTNFHSSWYNGEFPSTDGVLPVAEMNDIFLNNVGLCMEYVLFHNSEVSSKYVAPSVKLVYKAKQLDSFNFNPFTGVNIDYYGKDIVPVTKPEYTDLAGHWAEADILRLVDLGLLRLTGPQFRPDETIKLGDLLKMIADASGYDNQDPILPLWLKQYGTTENTSALWYGIYRGIIAEDDSNVDPETPVTREMLAFYLARMQGYGAAAKLKGIWSAPYSDFASVGSEYQGSVAIVHALGLLGSGGNGKFLPQSQATRAHVAVVLARMLNMAN